MEALIILIFVLGYLAITLEHSLKLDKLIPALAMMAICWALIAFGIDNYGEWFDSGKGALVEGFSSLSHDDKMHWMEETLLHHLGKTAEIIVFLLGAMTIVAIIDNLTATIVLVTILRKIVSNREDRIWFAGLIIIAANAGGAWSPIGDVTTTMLWIGNKVTTLNLIKYLLIPSLVCMIVHLLFYSRLNSFKVNIYEAD